MGSHFTSRAAVNTTVSREHSLSKDATMTRIPSSLLLFSLTTGLLASCNSATPGHLPNLSADRPGQVAPRYDAVASVPLQPGDTSASLQAASGGTVIGWNEGGEVLLGLNTAGTLAAQSVSSLSARLGRTVTIEVNRDAFSGGGELTATMGGARAAWAGGSFIAWTGGARAAWAGGNYAPIPQNTGLWAALHLQQAQTLAPNLGAGVVVAVIDTGLDLNHAAFQGALTDPTTWKDYYGGDTVPQDEGTLGTGGYGHGTNVAGIILQIAPKAKIMPIRVLGPDGSGDVANIASAITWAVAHGAQVINLSLGSSKDSRAVQDAIKAAAAHNVLITSSAGNANIEKMTFPASASSKTDGILSVGSVSSLDVKSAFSNYDQNLQLVAPGESVYAPAPGNMMAAWSGTSQAAPMAAGALALALGQTLKPSVTVGGLLDKLSNSALNVYSLPGNKTYIDKLGNGRIDLSNFLLQTVQ